MLLIIEGQARTGKTSVSQELIRRFRDVNQLARVFKNNIRSINPGAAIVEQILPLCFDDSCVWICDRAHITEEVYSLYHERVLPYDPAIIYHCDKIMAASGALLFYLKAEQADLQDRMVKTDRESEGNIIHISYLFDFCVGRSAITKREINTSVASIQAAASMIFNATLWMTNEGDKDVE